MTRARPGATVLGVHPTRRDADGKPLPVLTVGEARQGARAGADLRRLVALGLRRPAGDDRGRAYQRFWDTAIRWLIRDPALSFLRVETDQPEYARGQKVQVTVRALGTDYQPLADAKLDVTVARIPTVLDIGTAARPEPVASQQRRHRRGRRAARSSCDAAARRAAIASPRGRRSAGRPVEEDEVFLVRGAGRELEEPEARDDLLRARGDGDRRQLPRPGRVARRAVAVAAARGARQPASRRRAVEPLVDARSSPPAASASTGRCAVAGATRSG